MKTKRSNGSLGLDVKMKRFLSQMVKQQSHTPNLAVRIFENSELELTIAIPNAPKQPVNKQKYGVATNVDVPLYSTDLNLKVESYPMKTYDNHTRDLSRSMFFDGCAASSFI